MLGLEVGRSAGERSGSAIERKIRIEMAKKIQQTYFEYIDKLPVAIGRSTR
jgi:hypothetical protein